MKITVLSKSCSVYEIEKVFSFFSSAHSEIESRLEHVLFNAGGPATRKIKDQMCARNDVFTDCLRPQLPCQQRFHSMAVACLQYIVELSFVEQSFKPCSRVVWWWWWGIWWRRENPIDVGNINDHQTLCDCRFSLVTNMINRSTGGRSAYYFTRCSSDNLRSTATMRKISSARSVSKHHSIHDISVLKLYLVWSRSVAAICIAVSNSHRQAAH